MKISYLLKPRFTSILATCLITLQMSACSTENSSTATALPSVVDSYATTGTSTVHTAAISGTDFGSVTEDVDPDGDNLLEVGGKLNITDIDAGEAAFVAATSNSNYGSLTINAAGDWNYAANNSQSVIQNLATGATIKDSLTVHSIDGTTHTVVITIIGVDEAGGILTDVSLSWVAPSAREDSTPILLSEIAGYKIYYGTAQGQYANSVTINDGSADTYTFKTLSTGTYFFVVTTYDTDGRESQYSPEVKKVI